MKTMKRLCLWFFCGVTVLSLTACHTEDAPKTTTLEPSITTIATTPAAVVTPVATSDPIVITSTTPSTTSATTLSTTPETTPDPTPIGFAVSGDTQAVAEQFVTDIYREMLMRVPNGNSYSVLDYAVVSWEVYEVSEDGKTVKGKFTFAVLPEDYENSQFWTGNGAPGTGSYEGWIVSSLNFQLELEADGMWYCRATATGRL